MLNKHPEKWQEVRLKADAIGILTTYYMNSDLVQQTDQQLDEADIRRIIGAMPEGLTLERYYEAIDEAHWDVM